MQYLKTGITTEEDAKLQVWSLALTLTPAKEKMNNKGIRLEEIVAGRLSRKRPDGIAFKMTTETKSGDFYETGV